MIKYDNKPILVACVAICLVAGWLAQATVETESTDRKPVLRNADLSSWRDGRLEGWRYVPWAELEVTQSTDTFWEHPVVEVFHPSLGFLEQDYPDIEALRAGDVLSVGAFIRSDQATGVSLSFLREYDEDGETARRYTRQRYTDAGEWQYVEALWHVKEHELHNLRRITVHLRLEGLETPVKVAGFWAWISNAGLARRVPFPSGEAKAFGTPADLAARPPEDQPCIRL